LTILFLYAKTSSAYFAYFKDARLRFIAATSTQEVTYLATVDASFFLSD